MAPTRENPAAARRLALLRQAARAFADLDIDLRTASAGIVEEIGTLLHCGSVLALTVPDGRLHYVAAYHPDVEAQTMANDLMARLPLREPDGLTDAVLASGRAVIRNELDSAAAASLAPAGFRPFVERFPIHAAMVMPLRVGTRVIGVLSTLRVRAGEQFDDIELELAEALAMRAAGAIETTRLYAESQRARVRAEQLYRFAHKAVCAETLEQVCEAALDAITSALDAQRAAILITDDAGVMRFKAWRGLSDAYRAAVDGHSPWPRDAVAPQPVVVPSCVDDPAWAAYHELFLREHIGALAFVPLVNRGRLIGKFMVYYDRPHELTPSDLGVTTAIANHLASLISRFQAARDLERALHDTELFAGVLAHDLRNPLSMIISAAQVVLMRQDGDTHHVKPVGKILSSADRMMTMVDQLLDFTRARQGGGIALRRKITNLADVAWQVVGELELVHPERKLTVKAEGNQAGAWDPDRLAQVVSNLVGNACEHGATDTPIAVHVDGRAADAVVLEVRNGGTIAAAMLPAMFEPFRGRERSRGDANGLGLGLYIVREIVRAHGGTVSVRSTEHDGTAFTIRLPRS